MPALVAGIHVFVPCPFKTWEGRDKRGHDEGRRGLTYFTAEKRLSNEFDDTIGCEPATMASLGAGGAAGRGGPSAGFTGGLAAACLVSVCLAAAAAVAFGVAPSARGAGSVRLASITFGFAGAGCVVAVVSAAGPPRPHLGARVARTGGAGRAPREGGGGKNNPRGVGAGPARRHPRRRGGSLSRRHRGR